MNSRAQGRDSPLDPLCPSKCDGLPSSALPPSSVCRLSVPINALCHVDVVARGAPAAIRAGLGLDGDRLSGADGLAQLARDAALLAAGVTTEGVLTAEARRQRTLLERVAARTEPHRKQSS